MCYVCVCLCEHCSLPLFRGLGDLLQSAAGLLQLCQGVGWGQGWHSWVLDEGVAGVVATEVSRIADATSAPRGVGPTGQGLRLQGVGLL